MQPVSPQSEQRVQAAKTAALDTANILNLEIEGNASKLIILASAYVVTHNLLYITKNMYFYRTDADCILSTLRQIYYVDFLDRRGL